MPILLCFSGQIRLSKTSRHMIEIEEIRYNHLFPPTSLFQALISPIPYNNDLTYNISSFRLYMN